MVIRFLSKSLVFYVNCCVEISMSFAEIDQREWGRHQFTPSTDFRLATRSTVALLWHISITTKKLVFDSFISNLQLPLLVAIMSCAIFTVFAVFMLNLTRDRCIAAKIQSAVYPYDDYLESGSGNKAATEFGVFLGGLLAGTLTVIIPYFIIKRVYSRSVFYVSNNPYMPSQTTIYKHDKPDWIENTTKPPDESTSSYWAVICSRPFKNSYLVIWSLTAL